MIIAADTEYTKINSVKDLPNDLDDALYRFKVGKLTDKGFIPYHEEQSRYGVTRKYGAHEITHFARVPRLKIPTP